MIDCVEHMFPDFLKDVFHYFVTVLHKQCQKYVMTSRSRRADSSGLYLPTAVLQQMQHMKR